MNGRTWGQRLHGSQVSGLVPDYTAMLPNWMIDTGAGNTGGTGDSSEDDTTGSAGTGGDGKAGEGASGGGDGTKSVISQEEFDALRRRMEAADRNFSQAQAKIKEYEEAGLSEAEKAKSEADELRTVNEQMSQQLTEQAVKLAVLMGAKHITWHDPADALAFILKEEDIQSLEIKNGEVDAKLVKAVADRIAKAKPYLVKSSDSSASEQNGGNNGQQQKQQPSGGGMGGDRKDSDGQSDQQKLRQKYPALRR